MSHKDRMFQIVEERLKPHFNRQGMLLSITFSQMIQSLVSPGNLFCNNLLYNENSVISADPNHYPQKQTEVDLPSSKRTAVIEGVWVREECREGSWRGFGWKSSDARRLLASR